MTVIGFANVMYTLWDVETLTNVTSWGQEYEVTKYTYIKNISKDLKTVRELYPDAPYDETLKGKSHTFIIGDEPKKPVCPNVFAFGKYTGKRFDEVNDYGYIAWYFNNTSDADVRTEIAHVLTDDCGYQIVGYNSDDDITLKKCLSVDDSEYDYIINHNANCECAKQKIADKDVDFIAETNLYFYESIDGKDMFCTCANEITYLFDEVKEMSYQGYTYYLPILNGKAKRIKNKTIIVKDFEVIDNLTIKVLDFDIEK